MSTCSPFSSIPSVPGLVFYSDHKQQRRPGGSWGAEEEQCLSRTLSDGPGGAASRKITWPWCLRVKTKLLPLQTVPEYGAGGPLWCVLPLALRAGPHRGAQDIPRAAEGSPSPAGRQPRRGRGGGGATASPYSQLHLQGPLRASRRSTCDASLPRCSLAGAVPALTEGMG